MEKSQTFQDHVQELRKRFFWVAVAVLASATVAFTIRNHVLPILQHPLNKTLFYSSPAGGFNFVIRLSMIIGLFITLPVIIYQLLRFLEPAFPMRIRRRTFITVLGSSFLLACLGIAFGYFYMIPTSLRFFGEYSTNEIKPLISADSYLAFVINNLLTFALSFQIPLLILFINRIKPMKPSKLLHYQRHVIVASFVLALLLPFTYDPISQFMVAVPIIFLFYLSVIMLWFANRKKKFIETKPEPKQKPANEPPKLMVSDEKPTYSYKPIQPMIGGMVSPRAQMAHTGVKPLNSISSKTTKPNSPTIRRRILSIDGFVN